MFNNTSNISTIQNRIIKYVKDNYTIMPSEDFILGEGPHDHRCHYNSVSHAEFDNVQVVMCWAQTTTLNDDAPMVLHFINRVDGKYCDHTLGSDYSFYTYYYVRMVEESEYSDISALLTNTKKETYDTVKGKVSSLMIHDVC